MFQPQVQEIASPGSIIAFEVLSALEVGVPYGFVLKRRLDGFREERVYKLSLASTPKRCGTILAEPEQ